MPDDDDRPRDGSGAAGAEWSDAHQPDVSWAKATAPDDISELARDVQAYRRELRAAKRRQRYGRFAFGQTAGPLTLTVVALAVVAVIATLLTVMGPRSVASPSALPLAQTAVANGIRGGLLPDVSVTPSVGAPINAQSLRPAVVAVVPPGCGCGDAVHNAATSASTRNIRFYAVLPAGQSADSDSLKGVLEPGAILSDTTGAVEKAVAPDGLTLLLIGRHGTIYQVEPNVSAADVSALPSNLLQMLENGG